MKKTVLFDKRILKELEKFPRQIQLKFRTLFLILESDGVLEEPFAKKLKNQKGLFEIRVKHQGQWRIIYAYIKSNSVLVLSAFQKKSQKTPINEIRKAQKRLYEY